MRTFVYLLITTYCLLAACAAPRPTLKIALVAPFEGRQRQVGYDAFPAMRMALRDANAAGGIANRYFIEFVAYNDNADPAFAERVAHNVAQDKSVLVVIGHLRQSTTDAALPVYAKAGLPVLALDDAPASCNTKMWVYRGPIRLTPQQRAKGEQAMQRFTQVSGGPPPGAGSIPTYVATKLVVQAIAQDVAAHGTPNRAGVGRALVNAVCASS
jgi:ABC-type branched-subunit amino acid transport system substrate-binding protein